MKKKFLFKFYYVFDLLLTIIWILLFIFSLAGIINIMDAPYIYLDRAILIVFALTYFIRFYLAKDKKHFFIKNFFDLLAIIPLQFFHVGLLGKSNRVFRMINLLEKLGHKKNSILYRNGFVYTLYTIICIIFVGAGFFSIAEKVSYTESIWWSIATITTVGYGDIVPKTIWGRVIASITMFFGIGFISMLTSTLTTHFRNKKIPNKNQEQIHADKVEIKHLNQKIDKLTQSIDELSKKIDGD